MRNSAFELKGTEEGAVSILKPGRQIDQRARFPSRVQPSSARQDDAVHGEGKSRNRRAWSAFAYVDMPSNLHIMNCITTNNRLLMLPMLRRRNSAMVPYKNY